MNGLFVLQIGMLGYVNVVLLQPDKLQNVNLTQWLFYFITTH